MEPLETSDALRARAAEDLLVAQLVMEKDDELTTTICFHLQQYVEKSIKARLMDLKIPYGKNHDLILLVELLPNGQEIEDLFSDDLVALSHYATTAKYSARVPDVQEMERAYSISPQIVSKI